MEPNSSAPREPVKRMLAAIVFTDAVGFSKLAAVDEPKAIAALNRDLDLVRRTCEAFGGRWVKSTGDGAMLCFVSAREALECALEIQSKLAIRDPAQAGSAFQHRIGIHLGDVQVQDDDLLGDGVNVAARLQEHAEPGGLCVSGTVYEVARSGLRIPAQAIGPLELKNLATPIQAYRLHPRDLGKTRATKSRSKSAPRSRIGLAVVLAAIVLAVGMGFIGLAILQAAEMRSGSLEQAPGIRVVTRTEQAPVPAPSGPSAEANLPAGKQPTTSAPKTLIQPPAPPAAQGTAVEPAEKPEPPPEETAPAEVEEPVASGPGSGPLRDRLKVPQVPPEFQAERRRRVQVLDFGGLADWMDSQPQADAASKRMARAYREVQRVLDRTRAEVQSATPEKPIRLTPRLQGQSAELSGLPDGRVQILIGERELQMPFEQLPVNLLVSLCEKGATGVRDQLAVATLRREIAQLGDSTARTPRKSRNP